MAVVAKTPKALKVRMSAGFPPTTESEPRWRGDDGLHGLTLMREGDRYDRSVGDLFSVGSFTSTSRLVVGTGGFRSLDVLEASLRASESTIATVAFAEWTRTSRVQFTICWPGSM